MTRTEFLGLTKREPNDKYSLKENNDNLSKIDLFAQTISTGIAGIPTKETGKVVALTDASDMKLKNLVIYGNTTQNGTPTPEAPVDLVSVENPIVTISTYEPYKSQTLSVPYTLNGVGDVRDYVDFERGVLVRNTHSVDLSTLTWTMPYEGIFNSAALPFNAIGNPSNTANSKALCSAYIAGSVAGELGVYNSANTNKVISLSQGASVSSVSIKNLDLTNLADFKASMNGVMFIYQLAIPTETPLTAEEIEAFKQLATYYSVTTITNSENAEMGVEYFADTKIYIDNKFAELNRAILNNI